MFSLMQAARLESLHLARDPDSGLQAIIAIHNTVLGPALGGTRMWNYASEQDALNDVLRLSRGMTYKAAVSGLNLGGGKAVIWGNSRTDKTSDLFRALGRYNGSLGKPDYPDLVMATLHANNAEAGLSRLQMLISMHPDSPRPIEPLIGDAVHLIVHIARTPEGRRIESLLEVGGFVDGKYILRKL